MPSQGAGPHGRPQVGGCDLLLADELLQNVLVELRKDVDEFGPVLLSHVHQVGRDVDNVPRRTQIPALPDQGVHLHQVDHPGEVRLGADRQLDDRRLAAQALPDGAQHEKEVGPSAVHLVDEAHPGDVVPVGLTPHRLGLRFHTSHTVEHGHRTV